MLDLSRTQIIGIWAVLLLGVLFALPNALPQRTLQSFPGFLPTAQVNLGLDLQGGSRILLEANRESLFESRLEGLENNLRSELRRADGGAVSIGDVSLRGGTLSYMVRDAERVDQAVDISRQLTTAVGVTGARDYDVTVRDGNRILFTPTDAGNEQAVDAAMVQAVEVIRRRIDELGTREPNIIRQGADRIIVEVPGLEDPQALKDLLGQTAQLEFKMVDVDADPEDVSRGRAPIGSEILADMETGAPIVVERRTLISGDQLVDAQQTFQDGQAVVQFRFDSIASRRFARATQENVGRPFAIILDDAVISAPRINEPILGGSGVISGNFTVESANELAILLRSGKLPVELQVIEERTVQASLGQDSIEAGTIASIIAVLAVMVFMFITYGRFGWYANVALAFNLILIIGIMSLLGATLTLPGIAGFVLTVGAAVDANVLINERIREELRKGRRVIDAVDSGYRLARGTIFDANITNIIAAIIMFWLGSGPIKGFAVVLSIGILTSVFTAVTFTRMLVALWFRRSRPKAITI
ncbi:protein translocase subunit SecD [Pacificimonas flava]|uniref:Protein translocase subunit SecD n=2 Tax=Pacificimonas TaxID=1960290 RepID=A0A219B7I7_9SPHN|nr:MULTISPECIES: protein translocase subunit SecD [Pacificimonas]MBZ6378653.1 protein translocase subunit SecD [Pacificimonas aurantium]OWV34076.1 protein translocase subunit SecD [Pacificimonas flava]